MKFLRKNGWKFLLDIALLVLLALMYNKHALGIDFHEIGGLALCGLFIIHKLLNWKWIKAVTAGLFSSRTPVRQKVYWVLDFLLFASFTVIIVTGILISKVVFPVGGGDTRAKTLHYAAAAVALALAGVHLGLHMRWIAQRMRFLARMPFALRRTLAVVLSVAVLAFGVAQIVSTSFIGWIGGLGTLTVSGTPSSLGEVALNGEGTAVAGEGGDAAAAETGNGHGNDNGNGNGNGNGLHDGSGPHGNGNGGGEEITVLGVGEVLLDFASILLAFAVVTAWVDGGLKALKRRRLRGAVKASPAGA